MTGFGAAEGPIAGGRLRVEICTVNHRHFNLAARLPTDLASLEGELRERLRKEFDRGHVAVQARWVEQAARPDGFTIDMDRARLVATKLREAQATLDLGGDVTLELVLRQPAVVAAVAEGEGTPEVAWNEVETVVVAAAAECRAMRAREGEALAAELRLRLDLLASPYATF